MVELAWVERQDDGFIVRRARYDVAGETFEMSTPRGRIVLVLSALGGSRLGDAAVLTKVATSLTCVEATNPHRN